MAHTRDAVVPPQTTHDRVIRPVAKVVVKIGGLKKHGINLGIEPEIVGFRTVPGQIGPSRGLGSTLASRLCSGWRPGYVAYASIRGAPDTPSTAAGSCAHPGALEETLARLLEASGRPPGGLQEAARGTAAADI